MLVPATVKDIAAVTGLAAALWPGNDAAELGEEMLEAAHPGQTVLPHPATSVQYHIDSLMVCPGSRDG